MKTILLHVWLLTLGSGFGSAALAQDAAETKPAGPPPAEEPARLAPAADQTEPRTPSNAQAPVEDSSVKADTSIEQGSAPLPKLADSPPATPAAVHFVESIAALQAGIRKATPGDTIVLKNGSYVVSATINVTCVGTADQPITIMAESVGGVELAGTHGIKVGAPAAHVVISGFKFTHAAGKASIAEGTRYVRFTRNTFLCVGDGHYLSIIGDDAQIDYNDFGEKKFPGTMIAVSGTGSQMARRLWIHHNHFQDFNNDGSNGAEMVRMGLLSSHRLSKGNALVEHNLFVRCRGLNDLISNRSSGNTYRYNTFLDSPSAHLTVRQGDDCEIYGNIFRNTEGIRLYGDRHQVFSNYLERNYIGVAIGNGAVEISDLGDAAPANTHDRPDGCVIAFNTFVDNNTHYQMSPRSKGLGATNTVFANNILQGGAVAAKIDGPNSGAVWTGNVLWQTQPRDLPPGGFTSVDPLLAEDPDGIKRPQPESPVLGSAAGTFAVVEMDMDGQPRPETKSVGADEPGVGPARMLSIRDVGPEAGADIVAQAPAPAHATSTSHGR